MNETKIALGTKPNAIFVVNLYLNLHHQTLES